jgi:membrane protease YdiL (CAAX protease family)/ribosomal protein S18 acetylase RimI-like enzyme
MNSTVQRLASRRFDALLTLAGILGLVLFLALYNEAFPDATIELTLSRDQIAQRANDYLKSQGYDVGDYESVVDFNQSWWSSIYLQRTLGVAETNRLVKAERLPIWTWNARWFRPQQQEEFSLELMPDGEVIGFSHTISETAPGAALDQNAARTIAEKYLTDDRQLNLSDLEETSASSEEQPGGRIDHRFEWKRRNFVIGDGDLRRSISVQGDRVGSYWYWLRVPEAFGRDFSAQRNIAGYINNTAYFIGFTLFAAIAFGALIIGALHGMIEWRKALLPALLVGGISLLSGLNYLPLYKAGYSTTDNYVLFWLSNILDIVYNALYNLVFVAVLWLGGTYLAKQRWPRQGKILPRGNRWLTLSLYGWRGLMLGGVTFGYVTLFYVIAVRFFNGWTPLDPPGGYAVATPFPFLGPLATGIIPATTEELLFRLIGITAVLLALKKRWLALLIPGALWAFAHTGYVTDPIILRGVELTIEAVFLGLFFLRFGLFVTIMSHFVYNAGLSTLPLLRSSDPYYVFSGLIVIAAMFAPIIPGAIIWLRRRAHPIVPVAASQIDLATVDDVDHLTALAIKDIDWSTLLNDPSVVVVRAMASPQIVGVAAGKIDDDGTACILTTFVDPHWRRQYLGSELIDQLTSVLRERGAKSVQATVATHDDRGVGFFASQGWRQRVRVYSRSLLPEEKPKGWRNVARAWFRRLRRQPTD